jgi:hypothetical protein
MYGPPLGVEQKLEIVGGVCKNVSGLLMERTPGRDEDSRALFLNKGVGHLRTIFYNRLGARR